METAIKNVPKILLNNFLSSLYTAFAPMRAINIVTGTNTIKPSKFIYPTLKGVLILLIKFPPIIIVVVPLIAIKSEVPKSGCTITKPIGNKIIIRDVKIV